MPTAEEYSGRPTEVRLSRLEQTPGEVERAISAKTDSELSARPDARNWAPKEIVCHLRDVEELFQIRFHTVVALDEPHILVFGAAPNDLAPGGSEARLATRSTPSDGRRSASISATMPVRLWPHFSGAGPRCWRFCGPCRQQSGSAAVSTSAGVGSLLPTGSRGLRRMMTTMLPSFTERSKVGHEVSIFVVAQSNFGMQPTAFGRGGVT